MNIFVLDEDPAIAAQMLCDKHIVKMPLETAQLLSNVFSTALKVPNPFINITNQGITVPYKLTHNNHPCSLWARQSKGNFCWLIEYGKELCKEYTWRYKRKHKSEEIVFHKGVDYAAKLGTPIHAAAEGVVEYIGKNGGYGNYIKIKHKNEYSTCYAHISKFSSNMKLGSKVKQGQVIAYVGSTGVATGPHLHYEVIYNGKQIDPLTIAHKNEVRLLDHELKEFKLFVSKIDKTINKEGSSEKEV